MVNGGKKSQNILTLLSGNGTLRNYYATLWMPDSVIFELKHLPSHDFMVVINTTNIRCSECYCVYSLLVVIFVLWTFFSNYSSATLVRCHCTSWELEHWCHPKASFERTIDLSIFFSNSPWLCLICCVAAHRRQTLIVAERWDCAFTSCWVTWSKLSYLMTMSQKILACWTVVDIFAQSVTSFNMFHWLTAVRTKPVL